MLSKSKTSVMDVSCRLFFKQEKNQVQEVGASGISDSVHSCPRVQVIEQLSMVCVQGLREAELKNLEA